MRTGNNRAGILPMLVGAAGAAFLAAASSPADTIATGGSEVKTNVQSILNDKVTIESGRSFQLSEVLSIVFSREPVIPYPSGVALRNGTALCGKLWEFKGDSAIFRSASLGVLSIPVKDIAFLYFGPAGRDRKVSDAPAEGGAIVVMKSGVVRTGSVFAASAASLVFKTGGGLEKIPFENMDRIVFGKVSGNPRIVLRNGDTINEAVDWTGGAFTFALGGKTNSVSLEAIGHFKPGG